MAKGATRLHVVGPDEGPRARRPGPAVLSILLYALLFGGALWYLRAKSPLFQESEPTGRAKAAASDALAPAGVQQKGGLLSRDALLSGERILEPARADYFHRLAIDRCDCGCGRTLSDCLINEKSCSRSPALAQKVRETVNGKR